MLSIGYANTRAKKRTLVDAGTDVVVTDIASLVAALVPPRPTC